MKEDFRKLKSCVSARVQLSQALLYFSAVVKVIREEYTILPSDHVLSKGCIVLLE